jgi:hypothetical protein
MAVVPAPTPSQNLGFLSVFHETSGYSGGYLVTNAWGRPLEFRLSSAVQPNKVQQVLYGDTLANYLCGEVIGKTLVEKTATPVELVLADSPLALDLRLRLELPMALWHGAAEGVPTSAGLMIQSNLYCHARFPDDVVSIREFLGKLGALDLGEPFVRIREAMNEARKMGVGGRANAA